MEDADAALARRLGKRLRRRRTDLGWSQATLAEAIGTSVEYVSMLERGARLPSLPTLVALGRALSTSLDALVAVSDAPRSEEDRLMILARAIPTPLRVTVARMLAALVEPPTG